MSDQAAAIRTAAQTYLDRLYEGDADKLASVFHPTSALTWEENGVLTPLPRDQWLEAVRNRPSAKARGLPRQDEILQIDQASPAMAFVKLNCTIPPRPGALGHRAEDAFHRARAERDSDRIRL